MRRANVDAGLALVRLVVGHARRTRARRHSAAVTHGSLTGSERAGLRRYAGASRSRSASSSVATAPSAIRVVESTIGPALSRGFDVADAP